MIRFYPLIPVWLILLSGAIALYIVYFTMRHGLDMPKRKRYLLASLRFTAISLVILMLLCPGMIVKEQNRQRSNVVVLLDDSGSMATQDMAKKESRYRAALNFAKNLNKTNFSDCTKYFYTFNTKTERINNWERPEISGAQGGTDFQQAFNNVNKDVGLSETAAVILLSDGLDYSGFTGNKLGAPVFAVKFGTELSKVNDLRIENFSYPENLYTNEEFELSIPVSLSGYRQTEKVNMKIYIDGKEVGQKELKIDSGKTVNIPFKYTFSTPALHIIKISLNRLADEVSYLNNETELIIEVNDGQSYTVCYFPVLTNSFRPLVRQFRESGRKFTAVYRLRENKFNQIGTKLNPVFNGGIPKDVKTMKNVNVFILAATQSGILDPSQEKVLEKYVSNGGTLVLLGGEKSFGKISDNSPLSALMPVKSSQTSFIPGQFKIVAESGTHKNRFSERIAELCSNSNGILKALNMVESVKKGAEVLLSVESTGKYPLIVSLPYGNGKVIAILTNSLHLWGSGRERQHNFGVFWEQLINYAGHNKDDLLDVTVNKTKLPLNENLKVTVKTSLPDKTLNSSNFKLESAIYKINSDKALKVKKLHKSDIFYRTEFSNPGSGTYVLETVAILGGQTLAKRYILIVSGKEINEGINLKATNENFLKFCSEGRIYDHNELKKLTEDIMRTIRKNDIEREWYPLFETPLFYFALLFLLMAGWYLRRKFNLF